MRKIIEFLFNALAVKEFLIFTGTFFALTAFAMYTTNTFVKPGSCTGVIRLELAFTKPAFENFLSICGPNGIRAHTILIWIDYLLIISYTAFLGNLLGSLVRGLDREKAIRFFSLPILAGMFDVIENLLLQSQLSNPDDLNGFIIFAASVAASIKFLLLIATAAAIIYFLYKALTKRAHLS